jgi:hypothetical protein
VATNTGVTFPRTKIWVTDDDLVRKTEDYSLSGQLMRTSSHPDLSESRQFTTCPVGILIVDALRGKKIGGKFLNEKTQITIANALARRISPTLSTPRRTSRR